MPVLKRLAITSLRNISSIAVELSPTINIFYGNNGSGKTSILESVALLGLGRSFRSHKTRSLVNHNGSELTVFADLCTVENSFPVGVQKFRNGTGVIRVNGETIRSAATLAKQLPLLIINAQSFQLIEGSPAQRRQFLDWLVFHVKPQFSDLWRDLQKILKQRNSLLRRDKISYLEIKPWDVEFCKLAEDINNARTEVFQHFIKAFTQLYTEFSSGLSIDMEYYQGWDVEQPFAQLLEKNFDRDCRDGYTHIGPQRADIKIRVNQKPAAEVLSRGQEKALICAMTVALAQLHQQQSQQCCVFLVDDLPAELDRQHRKKLAYWLTQLKAQVLVTGVEQDSLLNAWQDQEIDTKVFHVKHGTIE